jgi:hypothetical protein
MKRPQPDIGDTLQKAFISSMATPRKLKRLWGTTTINGVEVFNARRYYYPVAGRPDNFEKLFRYLGAYNSVKEFEGDGIKYAYLYLNKNNGSTLVDGDTLRFVSDNLNALWWDPADGVMPSNLTLTTTIMISDKNTPKGRRVVASGYTKASDLIAAGVTKENVIANYDDLWLSSLVQQNGVGIINKGSLLDPTTDVATPDEDDLSPDDPWMATVARYALRTGGIPYTIKEVGTGVKAGAANFRSVASTISVTIEIPYYSFLISSDIVNMIASDIALVGTTSNTSNESITKDSVQAMDSSDLDDDPSLVTRPYTFWEDVSTPVNTDYSALWYNGHLRVEPLTNPRAYGISFKELSSYVTQLVANGYKKKKVPWWKTALAIILFIIVVVLSLGQLGWTWPAFAAAIAIGSVVLALTSLALSASGQSEWASAFSKASTILEPLIIVATIVNFYYAINTAIEKATADAAVDAVEKTATEAALDTASSLVSDFVEDLVSNLIQGATEVLQGKVTVLSLQFLEKMASLVNVMGDLRLEQINDRNNDLQAEYKELTKETSQESDVLKAFMYVYGKPATADWSIYASTFDLPYERSGGPLALGNVQRTTKQAMRKGIYTDLVFENVPLV